MDACDCVDMALLLNGSDEADSNSMSSVCSVRMTINPACKTARTVRDILSPSAYIQLSVNLGCTAKAD